MPAIRATAARGDPCVAAAPRRWLVLAASEATRTVAARNFGAGFVLAAAIMKQFVRPFLGFGYVIGYSAIVSCASALAGTWSRQRRARR